MSNKEQLIKCFDDAIRKQAKFVGVLINNTNYPALELIVNPTENIKSKAEYYTKAYDEDLVLNTCKDIRITSWAYGNCMRDLDCKLRYVSNE